MSDFDFITRDYDWSNNELRMLKYLLENDGISFMRYFFKLREGTKLILNWHHYVVEYVLQAVLDGKISRVIINIAPRFSKTEQAVLNFITRGLVINPRARFIHTSYSADRALESSNSIKDTIMLPEFQELWPMGIRTDTKSKKKWYTDKGGGMIAAPAGGQITGFGAGKMEENIFTGAFVNDDPVKPDDAFSDPKRERVNKRFNNTMRSRLAIESIPFINIMQRIHENDLSAFLLRGGSGDMWHHLVLPVNYDDEYRAKKYPADYTHGIPINIADILKCIRTGAEYDFKQAA